MGFLDSDYKPIGSVSLNQIAPQRKDSNTYFGELVLKNSHTGENTADNIRSEIFDLNTARLRRYKKQGDKYGYTAKLGFPVEKDTSGYKDKIQEIVGRPVDSITYSANGGSTEKQFETAKLSMSNNLYTEEFVTPGGKNATGGIDLNGTTEYIIGETLYGRPCKKIIFILESGINYRTNIPDKSTCTSGEDPNPKAYYAEYMSGTKKFYFYSEDPYFITSVTYTGIEIYPIISLQNNENDELPYESVFGPESIENKKRRDPMRALGLDFEPMSRQVFGYIPDHGTVEWNYTYERKWSGSQRLMNKYPTSLDYHSDISEEVSIPAFGSPEWTPYKRSWKANIKNCCKNTNSNGECGGSYDNNPRPEQLEFCQKNRTEREYYDNLVREKQETANGSKNITDVYFGLFVSLKKLDAENCVALYFTLLDALPLATKSVKAGSPWPSNNPNVGGEELYYTMSLVSGSLNIAHYFKDWSICRRFGVADPIVYPPGLKSAKFRHGDYTIHEGSTKSFDQADRPEYNRRDETYEYTRAPEDTNFSTMMELRVQDRPDDNGNPRYLEMRIYEPTAEHFVDVIRDGEFGQSGSVIIRGGIDGYSGSDPEKPYSDVLMWPISVKSVEEVKIFKRERLIRECSMFYVAAVNMQEVKWYQQGWFRIVIVIVILVVTYITSGAGTKGVIAVLKAVSAIVVLNVISSLIDNPLIVAVLKAIITIYTGYLDTNTLLQNAALLVEAAGVVVQGYVANEIIKLQEEMVAWRKQINEKEKEMEKMKREVGMDDFDKEWILYISSLAPVEDPEDFYDRVQNQDLNEIELGKLPADKSEYPAPQAK